MRKVLTYDHFSISQVQEFARCARKYYYHRIRGLPERPKYDLASGKALHSGLEAHNLERVKARGLKPSQILEVAVTDLENREDISELDVSLGVAKDRLVKDGLPPTANYVGETEHEMPAPAADDKVEKLIEAVVDGRPWVAYIDVELPDRVVDYKLLGRKKSQAEILRDPQLVLYRHLVGLPAGFVQLVRGKEQGEWVQADPSPAITAGVLSWICETVKQIEAARSSGVWPRTAPTNWACNDCPYFDRCFKESAVAPVVGAQHNTAAA